MRWQVVLGLNGRILMDDGGLEAAVRKCLMDSRSASSINSRKAVRVVGAGGNASSGGAALGVREGVVVAFFALPWCFLLVGLMMCWQKCRGCVAGCDS